jgi:hypothetical protein
LSFGLEIWRRCGLFVCGGDNKVRFEGKGERDGSGKEAREEIAMTKALLEYSLLL